jgi:hypothetical protein
MGRMEFKTTCNKCKMVRYSYWDFGFCVNCSSKNISVENIRSLDIDMWSDEGVKLQENGIKNCIKFGKEEKEE